MNEQAVWEKVIGGSHAHLWLDMAMKRVTKALSDIVGQPIQHSVLRAEATPVANIGGRIGPSTAKTVGVQLQIKGDARGQALLLFPWESALRVVDLLMGSSLGTTSNIGFAERTALAEAGNLAVAHFLNALVAYSQEPIRLQPSPSNVLVDTQEAILRLALMPIAIRGDDPLVIETTLGNAEGTVQIHFLIVPGWTERQRSDGHAARGPGSRTVGRA